MSVTLHSSGYYRAYKKINGVEHQIYTFDKDFAEYVQKDLENQAKIIKSLKSPRFFSACGRLMCLRVRRYKKTNKATFQLQVTKNKKQTKTERIIKGDFESSWTLFLNLWLKHNNLSIRDILEYKEQLIKAKRLYMRDVFNIENKSN